jgi:hypothetical protein
MSDFAKAIEAARGDAPERSAALETTALVDGPEVQLSVRLPESLRIAVSSTAAARRTTVTAFVLDALRRAVAEANDSFAGLASELSRQLRAEIRSAVEDGTYRGAAADVDREEAWL